MAQSDFRKFYFYQKYLWSPVDFTNLQNWIYSNIEGGREGSFAGAVLSGLRVLPSSGMTVTVDSGIASSPSGKLMVVPTQQTTAPATPVGNPAWSLVVLRPVFTDADFIPLPTNPSAPPVPLDQQQLYQIVVLNGTPAGNPVYPAVQSDDVVLMGFKLPAGTTTITRAMLDLGVVGRIPRPKRKISQLFQSFAVARPTEIYEVDCTASGLVGQLPPAGNFEGEEFEFIKVDPSANSFSASGNGAETISGQNVMSLDSQWDTMRIYSNGISWRKL